MRLGIITGSGSHSLAGLQHAIGRELPTRFGPVSLHEGRLGPVDVLHLSRHGAGHRRLSHQVEHRAHVLALRDAGAEAVIATTVCGAVDPTLALGSLIVFDDLYFLANRLPDGTLCTLHSQPGAADGGHWVFDRPFAPALREALLAGAQQVGLPVRGSGCYGHVDGPRLNSRAEIRMLAGCGVHAVSQTAGPEAVLCGEAGLPFALLGYVTDHANGVRAQPTPVSELTRLITASRTAFADTLLAAATHLTGAPPPPTGSQIVFGTANAT